MAKQHKAEKVIEHRLEVRVLSTTAINRKQTAKMLEEIATAVEDVINAKSLKHQGLLPEEIDDMIRH